MRRARAVARVDPRERGGAGNTEGVASTPSGRSPRTRGSRRSRCPNPIPVGSIPANAGEPGGVDPVSLTRKVDPRERGGAFDRLTLAYGSEGRSPRTRGSRGVIAQVEGVVGSIPANAGEPPAKSRPATWPRVDPRERGGAGWP